MTYIFFYLKSAGKIYKILKFMTVGVNFNNASDDQIIYQSDLVDFSKIEWIKWWIISLEWAFEEKNKPSNNWNYEKLLTRLSILKHKLENKDPVRYLIYLYYIKEFSVADICIHLSKKFEIDWPINSLDTEMNNFFNWKKRTIQEHSKVARRRNKISESQWFKRTETNKKVEKILDLLGWWSYKNLLSDDDKSSYKWLRNESDRTEYLLSKFWFIGSWGFNQCILEIANCFWSLATSTAINKILSDIVNSSWIRNVNFWKPRIAEIRKNNLD